MGRVLVRVVVGLLLVGVLLVVLDRAAALLVGRAVAAELQKSQRLASTPGVTVPGIPFLTQVVTGRYDVVEITMVDVPVAAGVAVDRLDATLYGVHAPARQAMTGELTTLPVERAEASGHVSFAALQTAVNASLSDRGVTVTLGRAGPDRVAVTGRVTTLIGRFTVRGQARVAVSKGRIAVSVAPESLSGIPNTIRDAVRRQLDMSVLAPELPFGLAIRSVAVDASGLQLTATGSNVVIA